LNPCGQVRSGREKEQKKRPYRVERFQWGKKGALGLLRRMACSEGGELVPVRTNGAAEFPPQKSAPSMFWRVILSEQSTVWESLPFVTILLYEANKTESFLNILMNKATQK
jgi:hypothetical protein